MSENVEIYGGPYGAEQDKLDEAFRDNKLDTIDIEDGTWTVGAKNIYDKYKEIQASYIEPPVTEETPSEPEKKPEVDLGDL